jgi:hypothetical protein
MYKDCSIIHFVYICEALFSVIVYSFIELLFSLLVCLLLACLPCVERNGRLLVSLSPSVCILPVNLETIFEVY